MELDDEVCLCFHVTKRKVLNFLRIHRPRRAAQLSECFGAGTGCGWCRKTLERYFQQAVSGGITVAVEPTAEEYAALRAGYIRAGGGRPPPGATPVDLAARDASLPALASPTLADPLASDASIPSDDSLLSDDSQSPHNSPNPKGPPAE